MGKTIKVIDLLNKIANGEEVPKEIKYEDTVFDYTKRNREGLRYLADEYSNYEDNDNYLRTHLFWHIEKLNDEVEIIDDEYKEIKPLTKQDIEALGYACGEIQKCFTNGWKKSLENKSFKEDKKIEKLELCMKYNYKDNFDNIEKDIHTLVIIINKLINKVNSLEKKQ